MIDPRYAVEVLKEEGVSFFSGVPDSLLKSLCAYIDDTLPSENHVITANEGGAVALAMGHHMATGEVPAVYMQNSGLGNSLNPLISLADPLIYSIPIVLIIGWRGEPEVPDEPQHKKQGAITTNLLDAAGIPYEVLPSNEEEASDVIRKTVIEARSYNAPRALLVRKDTFSSYKKDVEPVNFSDDLMTREEVLSCILEKFPQDTIYVGTTGKLSRELFELRVERGDGHEKDFLTVGGMGHASQIALGIARNLLNKTVVCLDGDGAALMHLGGMATIASLRPENYIHIIFNNGVHESVGGQKITHPQTDFTSLAKALNYPTTVYIEAKNELITALSSLGRSKKPALVECKIRLGSREDLGRPTKNPEENKDAFMHYLQKS